MGHRYAALTFTDSVREVQQLLGSRGNNEALEEGEDFNHILGEQEAGFIGARDSFYMASVSETGWPYLQHRGGPPGFVRILDERTIGFADFSGNRQYISVGNLRKDDRVALFFMDYPNRRRFKLLGRARLVGLEETALLAKLEMDDYRARVERGFVIHVEAFDWNCPQHITPRYTEAQIEELTESLVKENRTLRAGRRDNSVVLPEKLGDGPLELVVSAVRQLTPRVRAFELRDPNGGELPAVEAGANLQIPVPLPDGRVETRHFSICSNPARRDIYEIAVLKEENGRGGSRAVHESFDIGLNLRCGSPQNHFQLHDDARPAIFIAGGIGITPIKAMAQTLQARGGFMHLHYAGRSGIEMAFRDRLMWQFGEHITIYRSAEGERMDIGRILSEAPDETVFYVCGPERLLDAVAEIAANLCIVPERIRFERFTATVTADSNPIDVELRRSGKRLQVPADQSVLDALLEAGVDAPFNCQVGQCKTCAVRVLDGEPDHRDTALSPTERDSLGLMCPCVSRAVGDCLVLDI